MTAQIIGRHHPCGATWSSRSHAHCASCCQHFTSGSGFERHQVGGECQDPSTMRTQTRRAIFKQVRRAGCSTKAWALNNDREDDDE